jgi:hypothetical protein
MGDRDAFYDKCYDAWMSGRNPDLVSEDQYDEMLSRGYEPEDISWRDCYPNNGKHTTEGE